MTETRFEVRDNAMPGRGALATADEYDAAMRAVGTLNEQFWAQLNANGEGGVGARFRLAVVEIAADQSRRLRALSTVSG